MLGETFPDSFPEKGNNGFENAHWNLFKFNMCLK